MKNPTVLFLLCIFVSGGIALPQYDAVDYTEITDYDEEPEQEETPIDLPPTELIPPAGAATGTQTATDKAATMFKLPDTYSVHKAPPLIDGKPIPVEFSMLVFNIFDIKELQEEVSMEVNYKLYWIDTRLMNWTKNIDDGEKFTSLSTTLLHRIWHPDIFIDHIKRVTQPQLISSASSLRLYKDGSLRYTSRILLVITCRMDFHFYPADTQECNVTMKSFAFSTKQMTLAWRDGIGALLAKSIDVHNFDVALETFPDFNQQTKSNNYTALSFGIKLRRKLSYHIIQTYVPSTLFTVVSWLSFLVPPDSTPGRMAICVTTLLTVTAMFGSVKQNTPNVSYIKALDIWMFGCIVFIFLSLAQFTLVLKLRSKKIKIKTKKPKDKRTLLKLKAKAKPKPLVNSNSNNIDNNKVQVVKSLDNSEINQWLIDHTEKASEKPPPPKPIDVEKAPASPQPTPAANTTTTPLVAVVTGNGNNLPAKELEQTLNSVIPAPLSPPPPPPPAPAPAPPKDPTRYFVLSTRIEKYTPRIVPLLFLILTCIYWPYLLIKSEYYSLNVTPEMYYTVQ